MRKTFEALQAWRRGSEGSYPDWLADMVKKGLLARSEPVCPQVLGEAIGGRSEHSLMTSRMLGGDRTGVYEYELSKKPLVTESNSRWFGPNPPSYTRKDLKSQLLRRKFYEQVPILRCTSHNSASADGNRNWQNLTTEGVPYWSNEFWEERWLADVPYCCREANVLHGLEGPPFFSSKEPELTTALDLRTWSCAFGDHAWWWTYPYFDEHPNSQMAPHLGRFFKGQHGRTLELERENWWLNGLVQLQGKILPGEEMYRGPTRLAFVWERHGLKVARRFAKAVWLQGSVWSAPSGEVAGWLVWHYIDGSSDRVPIIYGRTTARFWASPDQAASERDFPPPVWQVHESAEEAMKERWIRLYRQEWENPRPQMEVATVHFISNRESSAAPFLLAVNLHP